MENLKLDPTEEIKHFKFEAIEISSSSSKQCSSNNKSNRRFSLRPRKNINYEDFESVPSPSPKKNLSTSINKNLETIFEDPQVDKNGMLNILGKAKVKRFITFNDFVSKAKIRHRKSKVKRLAKGKGKKTVQRKLTLEDVKLKLKCLESSEDELQEMEVQD